MRIASLFSGIGGFEVGINNSKLDAQVIFSSEIDNYASISYLSNFKKNNLQGDITKILEKNIPNHDFLVAGFPCQAFSIAGKREGFKDARGTLFFDIARILKEKQPKYILLENVKNLVSHDSGKTFKYIISILNEIGYTVDFTIINSLEAGLPQNRERTYIVGILNKNNEEKLSDKRSKKIDKVKFSFEYKSFNFFNTLSFNNKQKYIIDILEENVEEKYLITNKKIEKFLSENKYSENLSYKDKIVKLFDLPRDVYNDLERQRRVYSIYGIAPTILARSDAAKIYIQRNNIIRKFTPRESFRLQGFDDIFINNIIDNISMTRAYKVAGNAVSPPVITKIVDHLIDFMEK